MKGTSCLIELPQFDIIRGTAIDYMHQSILGIGRQLLKLWFLSKFHNNPWYIGRHVKDVDGRLLNICPTEEFQRLPRSLSDTMKFWKGWLSCLHLNYYYLYACMYVHFVIFFTAHEIKAWLMYYSVPVLDGILPQVFLDHHVQLVSCLQLLLQDVIKPEDIAEANRLARSYCSNFQQLYGKFIYNCSHLEFKYSLCL